MMVFMAAHQYRAVDPRASLPQGRSHAHHIPVVFRCVIETSVDLGITESFRLLIERLKNRRNAGSHFGASRYISHSKEELN